MEQVKECPHCRTDMELADFFDGKAYHCSECLFERWLPDGTYQECLMNMETGALSWKTVSTSTSLDPAAVTSSPPSSTPAGGP